MRVTHGNQLAAATLFGALFLSAGSCQHGAVTAAEAQEKTPELAAEIVIERGRDSNLPRPQRPRIVPRGGTATFRDEVGTSYVLVPVPALKRIIDGKEADTVGDFIAFRVAPGQPGILKVPEDFPDRDRTVILQYSILACEGDGIDQHCEYVEGGSPPWIIIPPTGP